MDIEFRRSGVLIAVLAVLITPFPAFAYVDPGSGALILQVLAAIGIGIMFYFRQVVQAVKRFFGRSDTDKGPS